MDTKKITKRDQYQVLTDILNAAEDSGIVIDGEVTYDVLRGFIAHEIELLDNKAAAAAKRAAEKRADGDALRERIYNVLDTENPMLIKEIVAALGDDEISPQMVTARLTQLINLEKVEKTDKTFGSADGKGKKLSAYRRLA